MKNHLLFLVPLLALAPSALPAQTVSSSTVATQSNPSPRSVKSASPLVAANYGKLPLSFEANHGQTDARVRFLSRGNGYSLFLTDSAAVLELSKADAPHANSSAAKTGKPSAVKTDVVRMELAGAAHGSQVTGADQLPGTSNYFIGKDPANWHTSVPTFAKVKYTGVYPGIDLVYYGNQKQLEYDFVVAPNADAKPIKLHFAGAEKLSLNADGDLTVAAKNGEIAFHKPVVYQDRNGRREAVAGKFTLMAKNTVGFSLGDYDHSRAVVIDPTLAYSTYFGGGDADGRAIAVDNSGNAYLVGVSGSSASFPVTSSAFARAPSSGNAQGYIAKLDPTGSVLIYSTYLGGDDGSTFTDEIAIDAAGNAYVTGDTSSSLFPTTGGAFQTTNNPDPFSNAKAFVTKLNPTGSALVYSTLLGGTGAAIGKAIAVDSVGNAYIAGKTTISSVPNSKPDFPTTSGTFQPADKQHAPSFPDTTGFVTKLNATGTALVYSTYMSGSNEESVYGLALDSSGAVYVSGSTLSSNFPVTPGAYSTTFGIPGGSTNAGFLSKLNPQGTALVYSTFFPASHIAVDGAGNIYANVLQLSYPVSLNLPTTANAFRSAGQGYVAKINPSGTELVYATFLSDTVGINSIAVDKLGRALVTGFSGAGFPATPDAFQPLIKTGSLTGTSAVFAVLNSDGSALTYGSYLGGVGVPSSDQGTQATPADDTGTGIGLDGLGNAYLIGTANSADFPVTSGAFQTSNPPPARYTEGVEQPYGQSAFVAKFAFNGATTTTLTTSSTPLQIGKTVTFSARVASVGGNTVPTGHVRFLINGALGPIMPVDGSGDASYTTSSLGVGANRITADYLGSPTTSASIGTVTETITSAQVATPIFSSLGGTYPFAIPLSIATITPGAAIHYTLDGTTPNMSSPIYTNPFPVTKSVTIKAIAIEFADTASTIATATFTIKAGIPYATTTVQSSGTPSVLGQAVTFTAIVKPDPFFTAVPTGSVSFLNGNVVMGTVPVVNGVATFTTSSLTALGHDITAFYAGSASYSASGSQVLRQIVNP